MLACLINNQGHVGIENVPIPSPGTGEAVIKLASAGICGTDIEKAHGAYGRGGKLGHEVSGTIERLGEGVMGLTKGDRVIAHHHVPCYNCHYCMQGDHTMCDLFKKTNFDPCGIAEYFRVPRANVERGGIVRLPRGVSFEEAAMIEPTACCVRALDKVRVKQGNSVLVVGLGPTGLTQIQILKKIGASPIIGVDLLAHRLEMARKFGASETIDPSTEDIAEVVIKSTNTGVDLAIVSTGNPIAILPALASLRNGGRLLLFGAPPHGSTVEVDVGKLFGRQVSMLTSYSCIESEIHSALQLLSNREIDLGSMISDRFTIKEAPKAIEYARTSKTAIKTIITSGE